MLFNGEPNSNLTSLCNKREKKRGRNGFVIKSVCNLFSLSY